MKKDNELLEVGYEIFQKISEIAPNSKFRFDIINLENLNSLLTSICAKLELATADFKDDTARNLIFFKYLE